MTDQEKYKFMEYYKWTFKSKWYSAITDKLVLATRAEMGFLNMYNKSIGAAPFGRFYLGGDGMSGMGYQFDGRDGEYDSSHSILRGECLGDPSVKRYGNECPRDW